MKCPKCGGRGTVGYFHIDHFVDIECDRCNGSGEVEMTKLCDTCEYLKFCARSGIEEVGCDRYKKDTTTNEEWLKQCTTEQLAEILVCMAEDKSETKTVHKENVGKCVWWLKQTHGGKS